MEDETFNDNGPGANRISQQTKVMLSSVFGFT